MKNIPIPLIYVIIFILEYVSFTIYLKPIITKIYNLKGYHKPKFPKFTEDEDCFVFMNFKILQFPEINPTLFLMINVSQTL